MCMKNIFQHTPGATVGKKESNAQTKWIRTISEREDYDRLTGGADTDAL